MNLLGVLFAALGFAASYIVGRRVTKYADLAQGAAIGICGVAFLTVGMPDIWNSSLTMSLLILASYGFIGALLYRAGRRARGDDT